jgi:hypothetical protein
MLRTSGTLGVAQNTKARLAAGHRQVALRDQLAAGGRGDTLHPGQHRHRQGLDAQHHAVTLRKQLLVIRQFGLRAHFLEVVPGAKSLALGGQHHHACGRVGTHGIQRGLQGGQHLFAQGIEGGRTVQRQPVHAAVVAGMQHGGWRIIHGRTLQGMKSNRQERQAAGL